MRYGVLYIKGGVGKSTLAVHWAAELCRRHGRTLLIDGDPNRTASDWSAWRQAAGVSPRPVTIQLRGADIYHQGIEAAAPYKNAVLDLNGNTSVSMKSALKLCQRVLVPIQPTNFAASKTRDFLEMAEEARVFNEALDLRAVIYGVHTPGKRKSKDRDRLEGMREFLAERGVQVFDQTIGHRLVYGDSTGEGMTVEEYRPKVAAATHEMKKLYEEIHAWT